MAMNLGISSYCLSKKLYTKEWTLFDIMDWAKAHDCTHMEVVPFGLPILNEDGSGNLELAKQVADHADKIDLKLSAFSLNAHLVFKKEDADHKDELYRKEINRIETIMQVAKTMGCYKFRNDVCSGQQPDGINTPEQFEEDFPTFVKGVQELADYAKTLGLSTTLENHGLYVNGADRVIRILRAAGRDNVGLTVDVGNFLCVDEDPVTNVSKAIKYADMVHLKDFYIRDNARMLPQDGMYVSFPKDYATKDRSKGEIERPTSWTEKIPSFGYVGTAAGNKILRGAIVGQGDMDLWKILSIIKHSGYEKEISLEFEGMEDCVAGTYYGLETARYIWDRV